MNPRTLRRVAAAVSGLYLVFAPPAPAQTAKQDSVANRARPDFEPLGLELDALLSTVGIVDEATVEAKASPLASLIVFPRLEVAYTRETNVFRTDEGAVADSLVVVSPSLDIKSDWANHSVRLTAGADVGRYGEQTRENFDDLRFAAAGTADATADLKATAEVRFQRLHLQRGVPDDPGPAGGAVVFRQTTVRLGAGYLGDVLRARFALETNGFDFDDSGNIDNDERDRVENEITFRLGYGVLTGTTVFVEQSFNWRDYDQTRDNAGFLQDSRGGEILFGLNWDVSGVTFAEFGVGYISQGFDEPRFGTASGPSFTGTLFWNPTDLLSVSAKLDRRVVETTQENVSGILTSTFDGRVDYGVLENLLLSLQLSYVNEDFEGISREDDTFGAAFVVRYLVNRNWFAGFQAGYDRRNSDATGADFGNASVTVRLGTQL